MCGAAVALWIRGLVKERFGEGAARALLTLDGGSVTAANAATLMRLPDVDGGLIGPPASRPTSS